MSSLEAALAAKREKLAQMGHEIQQNAITQAGTQATFAELEGQLLMYIIYS